MLLLKDVQVLVVQEERQGIQHLLQEVQELPIEVAVVEQEVFLKVQELAE